MNMMRAEGDWIILQFRWNEEVIDKVKQMAYDYGVKKPWDPEKKQWRLPLVIAGKVAQELPMLGRCPVVEDMLHQWLKKIARARRTESKPINFNLEDGRRLYTHQLEACSYLTKDSRVLAHDMGLGKTLASLVSARHMIETKATDHVLVIAPANLHRDWTDEIVRTGLTEVSSIHSWAGMPKAGNTGVGDYILIADEAHFAQSMDSQRTRAFLALAMHPKCIACWCLTGTPMRNGKPVNLYPLLLAIDCPVARNRRRYEKRYCGAKKTRFTQWDTNGSGNLEELRTRTSTHVLRKRTEECIDLPEKVRVVHQCDISGSIKDQYWSVFERIFSRFLENVEIEIEVELEQTPEMTEADVAELRKRKLKAKAVAQLNAIRQAASRCKEPEAFSMTLDAADEGRRVVIFAEFQNTVDSLVIRFKNHTELSVVGYHGGMTQKVRDYNYVTWKKTHVDVFVATPDSGGLGLNLQEGSVVIMLDRPYSPGDVEQAEKRCHRIGTNWPVTVYWLQAFPVDRVVDEMLLGKAGNIETVIEGGKLSEWDVLRKLFEADDQRQ